MAKCVTITRNKVVICTGDLRWRITLQTRSLTSPLGESVDFTEGFADIATIWAMVTPVKPIATLDNVTLDTAPTHIFTIRHRSDVSSENFILFEGKRYDIVNIIDPDMTKNYLQIHALETGSPDKDASTIGVRP